MEFTFFIFFSISKTHSLFKFLSRANALLQGSTLDIFQEVLFRILATSRNLVVKVVPVKIGGIYRDFLPFSSER